MLLREVTYGIELGIDTVTIDPFDASDFDYAIGNVAVSYSRRAVDIAVPGTGDRRFDIHGMDAGADYQVVTAGSQAQRQTVRADDHGVLRFTAPIAKGVTVKVRRLR
jgi:hypothetical protein